MSEIIMENENELEKLKNDPDKVSMQKRAKFTGFGTYGEYDINDRVNELMKQIKKKSILRLIIICFGSWLLIMY